MTPLRETSGSVGSVMFSSTGSGRISPCVLRSSGTSANPAAMAARGLLQRDRLSGHADVAADPDVDPEERQQQVALALALQTGEPQDFAAVDRERDVAQAVAPTQRAHLQQRLLDLRAQGTRRKRLPQRAPDHQAHDLVVAGRGHVDGPDVLAVAEDGGAVAQLAHLVHAVRDEDHRHALLAQPAHDGEDLLHLAPVERGGRLVEDQHPRLAAQRLGDLDQLPVGQREVAHRRPRGRCRRTRARPEAGRLASHPPAVDQPQPGARLIAEEEVLGRRSGRGRATAPEKPARSPRPPRPTGRER